LPVLGPLPNTRCEGGSKLPSEREVYDLEGLRAFTEHEP
jgi:hypothetical protein